MKALIRYRTEAELCDAFVDLLPEGWTAYPETAGFDLLLVGPDAVQIGVEAKLTLNSKVIDQISGSYYDAVRAGPDYRAVLVGTAGAFRNVCRLLGITVLTIQAQHYNARGPVGLEIYPPLPDDADRCGFDGHWFDWCPGRRCPLPDFVPDCAAGTPAPIRLTNWKVRAIKVALILEKRGYITRTDFKALGVDPRRWITGGWVKAESQGRFTRGEWCPDFRGQHPRNVAEIEAKYDEWAPPEAIAKQESLL